MFKSNVLKLSLAVGSLLLVSVLSTYYFASTDEQIPENYRSKREIPKSTLDDDDDKPKFSFDDIFNSDFSYNSFNPRWISGDEYIYYDSTYDVYVEDVASGDGRVLMNGSIYTSNNASGFDVSPDQKFILLRTNYVKGWRHSYNASYLVYDVTEGQLLQKETLPDDIQYITWAPRGNALAYVQGFNIFYRASPTESSKQLTTDGRANYIYNGIPDWVYEEEMISSNNVMYFSPDGTKLAYAQFNDTECEHIGFIRYDGKQYPTLVDVSYPKAGTTQPTNKVFIYDLVSNTTEEIVPPDSLVLNGDYLFNRVVWANQTRVVALWCNRAQNQSVVSMFDYDNSTESWTRNEPLEFEHSVTGGWLYQRRPYWIPVFGRNNDEFFMVLPNNGWQQLALVSGAQRTFLTQISATVTSQSASYPSVYHYDVTNDYVYFLATIEGPGKRQVYRQRGSEPADLFQCVTCGFASNNPGRCDYVHASFSTDGSYVVINCRGEGVPLYALCKIQREANSDLEILQNCTYRENNEELQNKVYTTSMSSARHGNFISSTGYEFHYEMWVPPNFDENMKYPLLIDVYAGPGYQNVDYLWTRSWAPRYVPVNLNAIVVRVDGRGSNFYGDEFMHEVYLKLGQKEIEDQIEAARYFGNVAYIDETNIAIWGWSYGGFATSHVIGSSNGVIKCGLAVAPLTDWKLYDTIYAERYMGDPDDNVDGYNKANVMNKAGNFSKSKYYLIHGMTDDNVHFQNAAYLEKALVNADVSFKNFFYADQDHSINVGNARRHVYKILTRELCECFGIAVPEDIWPQIF